MSKKLAMIATIAVLLGGTSAPATAGSQHALANGTVDYLCPKIFTHSWPGFSLWLPCFD